MTCLTCDFFNSVYDIRTTYLDAVYAVIAPQLRTVLPNAVISLLLFEAVMWIINPGSAGPRALKGIKLLLILPVVNLSLQASDSSGQPLVYDWVILPAENTSLSFAQAVLTAAQNVTPADAAATNGYSQLASRVEAQVFVVLRACQVMMDGAGLSDWFLVLPGAIILCLLFLFVFAIFSAYMVEAMFKTLAIGIVAPALAFLYLFPPTKSFVAASFRILFGSGLSIIFAAGAMGFTMAAIQTYTNTMLVGVCSSTTKTYAVCSGVATTPDQTFSAFSEPFFMLFVIGFVSILIHLQAKALASNLSGANDGAGPAAAVAGGAMAAVSGGAGMLAGGGAFGAMGLGGQLAGAAQSNSVTGALQQRGVLGAGASALASRFSAGRGGSRDGGDNRDRNG